MSYYYKEKKKNSAIRKVFLFLMAIAVLLVVVECIDVVRHKNRIYPGVTISGITVAGLNKDEVSNVIKPVIEKMIYSNRVFTFENEEFIIHPKEQLDANVELAGVIENAYSVCRRGSIIEKIKERFLALKHGFDVSLSLKFQKDKLKKIFENISQNIQRNPKEAFLNHNRIFESETGIKLDIEKFNKIFISNLNEIDESKYRMEIPVIVEKPEVNTIDILEKIGMKHSLSDYSTSVAGKEDNTIFNITLAAELVNGVIIKPEEVFSFNEYVGPAEKEDGFKESTIIANGKFVNGYGGGVCQVASTLYNALILGNFNIIERYNHSVYGDATTYVPLGRDSGIFYGYKDLRFKNNYDEEIVIFAKKMGDILRVVILGKNENKTEVEVISKDKKVTDYEIVREKDENLGKGQEFIAQEGVNGYEIKTYRIIRQDGTEKIELLSSDKYNSVPMIIREN